MVRLQFDNNKQYKITLPKALVEAKGWGKGTKIKIALDSSGNLVLKLDDKATGYGHGKDHSDDVSDDVSPTVGGEA